MLGGGGGLHTSLFTACILRFVSRSGFTQRPVVADLNGVKMGTSSGHTLSCQPHFPPVDQAAMPLFSPSNSSSSPFPHRHPITPTFLPRPCQLSFGMQQPPLHRLPPATTRTHFAYCQQSREQICSLN